MAGEKRPCSEILELVKAGGDAGWEMVWHNVVVPEMRSVRTGELARKYGVTDGDVMGLLYEDMIGRRKIELYRNDGGNLWAWMRQYARGYVSRANPMGHGEFSLDATAEQNDKGEPMAIPVEGDMGIRRKEAWVMTQRCLKALWNDDPVKAYVHVLKTRQHLTSEEVKDMLDLPSVAAVDQTFSRSVKAMRGYWMEYDRKGTMS